MRLLPCVFAVILIASTAYAADVSIKYFVNDYADVFTEAEEGQLDQLAAEIQASGVAQYAIVTVPTLDGVPIETYAIELAQGKLGDTQKDNGLLLLIAVEDHEYRFEVGSGLEGALTDGRVGTLGREYLVPAFRREEYGQGTLAASVAIRDLLVNGTEVPSTQASVDPNARYLLYGMLGFFALMLIISVVQRRRKKGQKQYFDAADGLALLFWGRGPGGGGFGGLGGSGGGGFGGFGGGGFSGGGSSGGW